MNKNHQVIKFKNRAASYLSDKRIADSYSKGANFDVDLITADDKIVSAHRFVLAMFSKYLAKILLDLPFDGKILGKSLLLWFQDVKVEQKEIIASK